MKKITFVLSLVALVSCFTSFAQKKDKTDILVEVKEELKPLIIVDGKKFDFPMDIIDQSKIESVFVLKGDDAKELYNTSNGVILITTKTNKETSSSTEDKKTKNIKKPLIIVDGEISNYAALDKIEAEQIEKMEVLKGKKAIEKHNAPNGVIIMTTKKE